MRVLITGGAGFVGSSLAHAYREKYPAGSVTVLDNLRRRGSELNLAGFRSHGIEFRHGDIRIPGDLWDQLASYDVMIEASAEASVHAGVDGAPGYVLDTNLKGTLHCLDFARARAGSLIFLSSSRVYSIQPLREIRLHEAATRFEIVPEQVLPGVTPEGVSEEFPVSRPRSLYGASKLAAELVLQEYVAAYGVRAVIDRCGVISGPGQFGHVDQGVFTWWVASHHFGRPLRYTGFGGTGKQVRDILHPEDLFRLLELQIEEIEKVSGEIFNVGGGRAGSVSMRELTELCREVSGSEVAISAAPETSSVDIPLYISDHRKATRALGWTPERTVREIVQQTEDWIRRNEDALRPLFAEPGTA